MLTFTNEKEEKDFVSYHEREEKRRRALEQAIMEINILYYPKIFFGPAKPWDMPGNSTAYAKTERKEVIPMSNYERRYFNQTEIYCK